MNKYILIALIALPMKIGIEPWCTKDLKTGKIECNYESREACEGYRESNETCIKNKDYKESKHEDMSGNY